MSQGYVLLAVATVVALINFLGAFLTRRRLMTHQYQPQRAFCTHASP
jgi:hypothetical protein